MATYLKNRSESLHGDDRVRDTVSEMLARIEREREDAVRDYSERLDRWSPETFVVSADAVQQASDLVTEELKEHIDVALGHVRSFAAAQRATVSDLDFEVAPGVQLGHRLMPIERVGTYVPGGAYQMFASSFMTVAVAKVAGVSDVTATSPPRGGQLMTPAMLYAIASSGADRILCLG